MIHRAAGEEKGYFLNSSVPVPPASQTLKTLGGRFLQRELTSAHS